MTAWRSRADLIQPELPVGDAFEFLGLIWAVDHALQRRSKWMARTLGVTSPQRLVIRIIGRFPGLHARQLADILHLHPSSLTVLLKRLERRGLILRRLDGRDRRRWLLGLTRRGQALNRDTPGTIEAAVKRTLRVSARHDLDGLGVVLRTLARELDSGDIERQSRGHDALGSPARTAQRRRRSERT